ncbi:MAG: Ig-like domain-containing protein [Patescibacteria group bacterium]|nr:Ig-like domain-containing protein [Patescibacteria group bacterium]
MLNNHKPVKIHFPTALGLLILLIAIGVGIFFIKTRSGVKPETTAEVMPEQVRITNVTDTGFSVSWITGKEAIGLIKLGEKINELKQQVLDDRDQLSGSETAVEVHHATAKNLLPATKYYFKIESGGKQFDNKGKPFEVTTGAALGSPPTADPIYGTILTQSGTPAEGVVIYINVANGAPLSALAKTNGNWALSLSTARTADLGSYLTYDTQATIVNLLVQGGKQGTASAITTTTNDNPVPEISLGKSHDFRTIAMAETPETAGPVEPPNASESGEPKTGFSALNPQVAEIDTPSGEVTLDNPSFDDEIINATRPAFMGTGPAGTVLAIEINSENTYTGSVTINEDGTWEFTPPEGLTPGNHSVTINYIDTNGEEQVLNRTFIIAQAGETEVPAITATPSGEIATDAGRTSMPSTESGVPQPGTFEVTLLILLSGLGLLVGGLKIKNII